MTSVTPHTAVRTNLSQPALKAITRISLHRVATPVPRTMSRRDALAAALADADARIEIAFALLARDATELARLDWPAFRARVDALLYDLDTSPEVITALRAAVPEGDADPGREWWLSYAKELARDLRRIKDDPDFVPETRVAKRSEPSDLGGVGGRAPDHEKKAPRSEFSLKRARRVT